MNRIQNAEERKDRTIAILVFVSILLGFVFLLYLAAAYGLARSLSLLPPSNWADTLILTALGLYVIAGTDYPQRIRQSPLLRVAVACLALWSTALGGVYYAAYRFDAPTVIGYFTGGVAALLTYYAGMLYRDRKRR